jgi:hypothetical protein
MFENILKPIIIYWKTFLLFVDDEILKKSQNAHFYNNRNNGKEDFDEDFSRFTKSPTLPAKQKLRGRQRERSNSEVIPLMLSHLLKPRLPYQ